MTIHFFSSFDQEASIPCIEPDSAWTETNCMRKKADCFALLFMLAGSALMTMGSREALIRRGDAAVIPPRVPFAFSRAQALNACLVLFQTEEAIPAQADIRKTDGFAHLFRSGGKEGALIRLTETDRISAEYTLDRMRREFDQQPDGYQTFMGACLAELIVTLSRRWAETQIQESGGSLARAVSWAEAHYTEEISLEKLAEEAGVSPRHVDRMFSEAYGMTPKAYIVKLRMHKACALLRRTEKSITDIAFECGYSDSNYFARVFRKSCGMSPQNYRRNGSDATQ
jgi:AraC-like DNA-binding protein